MLEQTQDLICASVLSFSELFYITSPFKKKKQKDYFKDFQVKKVVT